MPSRDDDDIEIMSGLSVDREDAAIRNRPKSDSAQGRERNKW